MENPVQILKAIGVSVTILGMLTEFVGTGALVSYRLRRRLRWSPFTIISVGGVCFVGGLLCYACATAWLES
jgi:hypothetical protein